MFVKNAKKFCAALILGMTTVIASPLKSVAAPVSYEITWKGLYPSNDVVLSFVGDDIDRNGIIDEWELNSIELMGVKELDRVGSPLIDDVLSFKFNLKREELEWLTWNRRTKARSRIKFWIKFEYDYEGEKVSLNLSEWDDGYVLVGSPPVVTVVATEQPRPVPTDDPD